MKKYIQNLLSKRKQKQQPTKQVVQETLTNPKKEAPKAEQLNDNIQSKVKEAGTTIAKGSNDPQFRSVEQNKPVYDPKLPKEVHKAKQLDKGKDKGRSL
ncbi:MAG: hypothetical protein AAFO69_19735 [Bacteroidota bacterium]